MASQPVSSSPPRTLGAAAEARQWRAIVLAASVPFVFVHADWLPTISLGVGSTTADVTLADLAVWIVGLAAAIAVVRGRWSHLRGGTPLWIAGTLLLAWVAYGALRPASLDDALHSVHLVSAAKFAEYAILAPAVPILVRSTVEVALLLRVLVGWGAVAAAVGFAQFCGLGVFEHSDVGARQASFLGFHDFASLAGVCASIGLAGIAARRASFPGSLVPLGIAAGVVGVIIAGSVAAAGGLILAAATIGVVGRLPFSVDRRRTVAMAVVVGITVAGVVAIRGDQLVSFMRFIGVRDEIQQEDVETYSQRTLLTYIGIRIWRDHPFRGVGWQRSSEPEAFTPYLADAHRRFPSIAENAFPAPGREWGVQNVYVQALADLGSIGLALLLATLGAGLRLAVQAARAGPELVAGHALVALGAIVTLMATWTALGLVPGIPLAAATALMLGLSAALAQMTRERAA